MHEVTCIAQHDAHDVPAETIAEWPNAPPSGKCAATALHRRLAPLELLTVVGWLARGTRTLSPAPALRLDKLFYPLPDRLADLADDGHVLAFWVLQCPVYAPKSWHVGTLLATAHGDQQRARRRQLCSQELTRQRGGVYTDLAQRSDHLRVRVPWDQEPCGVL